jgi:hypothetical protein
MAMIERRQPVDRAETGPLAPPMHGVPPDDAVSQAPSPKPTGPKVTAPGELASLPTALFTIAVLGVSVFGYSQRHEYGIVPNEGVGYWLGVVGSLMMLALLLYPVRKKRASWQRFGTVAGWFKWHMILGVVGPLLILLHSGFRISATNSAVAALFLTLVVVSGIVGRYLYSKLHIGIYGTKSSAMALMKDADVFQRSFGEGLDNAAAIQAELAHFVAEVLPEPGSISGSVRQFLLVDRQAKARHFRLMVEAEAIIAAQALRQRWSSASYDARLKLAEDHLDAFFASLKQATGYRIYERLFAHWHVFHMPLFLMLIFVVLAHVFAVHWY